MNCKTRNLEVLTGMLMTIGVFYDMTLHQLLIVTDVSKDHCIFICRVNQSNNSIHFFRFPLLFYVILILSSSCPFLTFPPYARFLISRLIAIFSSSYLLLQHFLCPLALLLVAFLLPFVFLFSCTNCCLQREVCIENKGSPP